jgi:hypothetical protein
VPNGNGYDTDITKAGSYQGPPPILLLEKSGDPEIAGTDDNFQDFIVVQAPNPIPEPASLLLLGSGMTGLLYYRRRRKSPGAPPKA